MTSFGQVRDHICENILTRRWAEGERLPSVREMAVGMEVNPNTVMRTYTYLQEMGIIYNKRGIGYFVSDNALENVLNMKKTDFINKELPSLFKTMDLLEIDFDDLKEYYEKFQKESNEEQDV
ncbi:MAG: GntR family transcriptional regulator [Desulfobacteraceae bacterium]|nr:GntR family transcriptional regulator [Desulfobacteraceae bacterium]